MILVRSAPKFSGMYSVRDVTFWNLVILYASIAYQPNAPKKAKRRDWRSPGGVFYLALEVLRQLPFLRGHHVVDAGEVNVLPIDPPANDTDEGR